MIDFSAVLTEVFTRRIFLSVVLLVASALSMPLKADCECGSEDSAAPCNGTSVSLARGPSSVSFSFQCADGECACGKFANGWDFWVAPRSPGGTVLITGISPDATTNSSGGLASGWVRDPGSTGLTASGMDARQGAEGAGTPANPTVSDPIAIPTSPTTITSIVKAISKNVNASCNTTAPDGTIRYCFDQIETLTVLGAIPLGAGSKVLRPNYFGENKRMVKVEDIRFDLLPNLPLPTKPSGLVISPSVNTSDAVERMKGFKVDWGYGHTPTEYFAATSSWQGVSSAYPPGRWGPYWDAAHWAVLDVPLAEKRPIVYWLVQHGIDALSIVDSYPRPAGPWLPVGGMGVGRYGIAVAAAALVDDSSLRTIISSRLSTNVGRQTWAETGQMWRIPATGTVVYGGKDAVGGYNYADCTKQTNSIEADHLGINDDGRIRFTGTGCTAPSSKQGAYQAIVYPSLISQLNLLSAIPEARKLIDNDALTYASRVFDVGVGGEAGLYDKVIPQCAGGINQGKVCLTNSQCPSSSCANMLANWSSATYNSFVALSMWETYKDCYSSGTCPGMPVGSQNNSPPAPPTLDIQ
jgi:hypothetical protein